MSAYVMRTKTTTQTFCKCNKPVIIAVSSLTVAVFKIDFKIATFINIYCKN